MGRPAVTGRLASVAPSTMGDRAVPVGGHCDPTSSVPEIQLEAVKECLLVVVSDCEFPVGAAE